MASVPQKNIALSAVKMNIDQIALEFFSVEYNDDSPRYKIHDRTSSNKSPEVTCCKKNNPPLSMIDGLIKGVRVQMILKTYSMGYKTLKLRARIVMETIIRNTRMRRRPYGSLKKVMEIWQENNHKL